MLAGRKPRRVLAELPFAEARSMARAMGMSSREEWDEYDCPGAYRLPKDPEKHKWRMYYARKPLAEVLVENPRNRRPVIGGSRTVWMCKSDD